MIYLSNEPYPQEISVPRSFGVIVPQRNTYLSTADIATDLTTDSDTKVLAASQGVVLKEMVDAKADKSNTYTKAQVNSALALKADKADTYTKAQVDGALAGKQDELVAGENITIVGNVISATGGGSGDSYTRAETDALLAEKADVDDVYTKSEVDTALAGKADVTDIPTKTSDLQNDSGFVTGQEVSQTYETKSDATAKETALQTAINAKQDILTFDNVPTNGSSNPVKSDGIYDALAGKQATIQDLSEIRSGAAAGATAVQPAELTAGLATKQDTINDLATIRSGAAAGATAVQPSQMQAALAGKQDVLTFDTTPTQGSTNPVTSGGIYDVIGDIETLLAAI